MENVDQHVGEIARAYSKTIVELTNKVLNTHPPYERFKENKEKAMVMINLFNDLAIHFLSCLILEIKEDVSNENGGATEMLKLLQEECNDVFQAAIEGRFDEVICTKKVNTPKPENIH